MTNPGCECNRKRKRDAFIFNQLFGTGGIELTNMGLLGGLGSADAPNGGTQPPPGGIGGFLPGFPAIGGPSSPAPDTRAGLLGQQNNNIYTNQNQNNPNLNNNNVPLNPFAAALGPLQGN